MTPREGKCRYCGKPPAEHRGKDSACPIGRKHRTLGYTGYSAVKYFERRIRALSKDGEKQPATRDPRDPDPTKEGMFRDHNCWKCKDGALLCVVGEPRRCEYPHARND